MDKGMKAVRLAIGLMLAIGVSVGIFDVVGPDGPRPTFAQTDSTAPTVSSLVVTSDTGDDEVYLDDDGVYGIGDTIDVTVTFNEDVTLTGFPRLELTIGSSARNAAYKSTTGSKVVFGYTVAVGDSDTDGISIVANKLSLNGGSIKDAAENDAVLSHSAVSTLSGHKVDGIKPTITRANFIGSSSGADDVHTIGEYLPAGVRFSEHVYVGGYPGPQMKLNFEGATKTADFLGAIHECGEAICVFGPGSRYGINVDFDYKIVKGDLDLDGVAIDANSVVLNGGSIRDGAGNDAVLTHGAVAEDSNYIVDGVPATVRSVAITSDPGSDKTYGVGDMIEVTVTFSESVRVPRWIGSGGVVRMPLLELNLGGVAKIARTHERSTITGTALVFSYTVQDGDNDADGISIGANKLTTQSNYGIADNYSGCCPGGENADLTHSAVADDSGHKVATSAPAKSADATLSALTLSSINFGIFASDTTSYSAQVANSVSQTTVTPAVNDSEGRYVIKLGGVSDADGVIPLAVGSNVITVEVTAEDDTTTKTYTVTVTRAAPLSTDATLGALTLSDVNFGTFASGTTSYTADVASSVTETTVTPTVNHSGASYVIKIGGVTDADGVIPLAAGDNVITIEVTAEDGTTTRTYTVTVTRAAPPSSDATLKSLSLGDDISIGTFSTVTTSYSVQVANSVSETTVTPTVNHSGASYVIKFGGVTDSDGVIPLGVGSNVITVEVTAEDGNTTQTYKVTVTRAEPPSTDATLKGLTLSRVDFGTFSSATTSYTAQVVNSVTETTVTPTVNDSGARYVIKLGSVTDADGVVSLAVGANVITVEVTAEDDSTAKTYRVTVTRAEPPSTDATLRGLILSRVDFGTFDSTTTSYTAQVAYSVSQTSVTPTVNDPAASYVIKLGGVTDADGTISLAVGNNVITVVVTAEDDSTTQTYTVRVTRAEPPSTDATLKGLTLSDVSFGTFSSATTSYTAQVANSVTETTVTPTVNDSGASYVITLGGVTDADGTISLAVGSNVIIVVVTAEDGVTTQTYTVTVTREQSSTPEKSSDATLKSLTLSGIDFGTFDSTTISYSARVANSVSQTTITPAVNDSGASYVIKLGGVADADGTVSLAMGSNVVTVEVAAEDGETTKTYTVTVARSAPPSTDATLSALGLSGVNIGTFASDATSYTAQVANSVSQTTVTPTVSHSGARYVIKLGGVTDADGTVSLSVGNNVITIVVTAQDGRTTQTYTVTVTRSVPLSSDAALSTLTLSGVDFGTFDSSITSYSAQVANSVTRTTVSPSASSSGARYVIKLGGVTDTDGTVSLSVSRNVITIEVTAQDGSTTRTYTVTITRASENEQPPRSDAPVTGELPADDPKVNFRVSGYAHDWVNIAWAVPQNRGITRYVVQRYEHDGSGFVSSGSGEGSRFEGTTSGGDLHSQRNTQVEPDTLYQYVLALKNDSGTTIIESSSTVRTLSSDATLSTLTLSDTEFGTFNSETTSYSADVANEVSRTTVIPSLSHTGASHVIRSNGAVDEDGDITLEVGENVITVVVTAQDGVTTQIYTVRVTRGELEELPAPEPAPEPDPAAGICDRTAKVQDAILAKLNEGLDAPEFSDCSEVTDDDLGAVTGSLILSNMDISALKSGDFQGLSGLTSLYLDRNNLSSLPEGVFRGSRKPGHTLALTSILDLPSA